MPTTIAVAFPWGLYHGTPWGRNANEGVVDWPPEPWRLLRALYAVWRGRAPELPAEVVESVLDALAEPPDYYVPAHAVAHTRHFYPDAKHGPNGASKDKDKVFDAFAVMARESTLYVSWPAADLDAAARRALGVLCDRLTYLGRAESICSAWLCGSDVAPPADDEHRHVRPAIEAYEDVDRMHAAGRTTDLLAAARPLDSAALEARPQRLRKAGRIDPPGTRRVRYPLVAEAEPATPTRRGGTVGKVTAVRFRLSGPARPSRHAALAVTEALRAAAIQHFDPQGTHRSSPALFGKDASGARQDSDHRHAHYLAFAADTGRDPRLDTVVVWTPMSLNDSEIDALAQITLLGGKRYVKDFRPCPIAIEATGELDEIVPELARKSQRWESSTPYAPPRHIRRQPTWYDHAKAYLKRDLAEAAMPAADITELGGPWLSFRRHRMSERLPDARRATGFRIEFREPVAGPLCLGALRHFGLGLFVPV